MAMPAAYVTVACDPVNLAIEAQISAPGLTWIDRQLLVKVSTLSSSGFGAEVREAMDQRIDHLVDQRLARRQGRRVAFAPTYSIPCAGASSTRPPPIYRRKPG